MGISNAVSGGIMMITMVYVMLTIPGMLDRDAAMSNAIAQRARSDDAELKTGISITSISLVPGGSAISVELANDGSTKLWEYSKFTVIAAYDANVTGNRARTTEELEYGGISATPAQAGQWVISSFDSSMDSYVDPQVVNPGEQFTIKLKPQNPIYASSPSAYITVSTQNGVTASKGGTL
jgi:archaellum component FlaF (FlaF/FlaG flagellin family)